jgi:hypothetical protein
MSYCYKMSGFSDHRFSFESDMFWGTKVTRRYVDPITYFEKQDVVPYPRIEDASYETTNFACSQPRFPVRPFVGSRKRRDKNSGSSDNTSRNAKDNRNDFGNGISVGSPRRTSKPSTQQQRRSTSLPTNQNSSPSKRTSKSPARNKQSRSKKAPTAKPKPKTSSDTSLGAFLHRNTVQKIIREEAAKYLMGKDSGVDNRSIGSKSMASMSVSDRSHAERSKAEESLARQAKERRAKAKRVAAAFVGSSDSLPREHHSLAMASIDEMSITDFSGQMSTTKTPTTSPTKSPKKGSLGGFLSQQAAIDESANGEKRQYDAADAASVASASTLGSKSISARSKAEQSGPEKILRQRKNFAMGETLTEEDEEDDSHQDRMVQTNSRPGCLQEKTDGAASLDDSLDLKDAVVLRAEKNLRFQDGHSEKYISLELTPSMYDDLFYTSVELAEFRYEAFMEEAGLDINEFS